MPGSLVYNRFSNQTFVHRTIDTPSDFLGQIVSRGIDVNAVAVQLNKKSERVETNIPSYYLGFEYEMAYIEDKINPSHLRTQQLNLKVESFKPTLIVSLTAMAKIGLVVSLGTLLSDEFRMTVFEPMVKMQRKFELLYIVLDGSSDELRILYTDLNEITQRVVVYGDIEQYMTMDTKSKYGTRTVFSKDNPVRLDLILNRTFRSSNITAIVQMLNLDFINTRDVKGTQPVRGMFLPIDLYEAFCLEGNFMTYDINLIENKRLYFPSRYNRTGNFYENMADILITNSPLDIGLMYHVGAIDKYKKEYRKMITGGNDIESVKQ